MRKKKKFSWLSILILLVLLTGLFFLGRIYLPYQAGNNKTTIFQVKRGEGLFDISSELKKQGIIPSTILFNLTAIVSNLREKLQAGDYRLSPSMSPWQILKNISSGKIIKEKITIIDGWNLNDIANYLEKEKIAKPSDFFSITGRPEILKTEKEKNLDKKASPENSIFQNALSEKFNFLKQKPKNTSLEGYLFPDTYEVSPSDKPIAIVEKMLANFNRKVNNKKLIEKIRSEKKTLYQIITIASLVQKEVKSWEDRRIVAGILWKRAKNGWPLQVDASITYLTGKPSSEINKTDLKIDSKYNTYKYPGLPAGPICNPGLESIKAAVYYKESPYWFYLNEPGGETIFSRTLEEHNRARAKYLKQK